MGKHTPGPWIVCVNDLDNAISVEQDRDALVDEEPTVVLMSVDDMGEGLDREVATANAALIAAAPDLLAVLKRYVNADEHGDSDTYQDAIEAIARAEGK